MFVLINYFHISDDEMTVGTIASRLTTRRPYHSPFQTGPMRPDPGPQGSSVIHPAPPLRLF